MSMHLFVEQTATDSANHASACPKGTPCRAAGARPGTLEPMPRSGADGLIMTILRFVGAAYATGDAACWDAAHAHAEAMLGLSDGPVLVARAGTVLRILRGFKGEACGFLPPCCIRLSMEESAILQAIRDTRGEVGPAPAMHRLGEVAGASALVMALRALDRSAKPAPPPIPVVPPRPRRTLRTDQAGWQAAY